MNKRQRLADLSIAIFRRAVELFDPDKGMSFTEARKLAAQELATTERLKPRAAAKTSTQPAAAPIDNDSFTNSKEQLFSRIFGIKERQEAKTIGGRIKRFIFTGDQATTVSSKEPTASPSEATPATPVDSTFGMQVYSGNFGPNLIPDDEYPVGMCDHATANWRKSLTESLPRKPENEIDPTNQAEVEAALQRQNQNIIGFPKVSK